MDVGGEIALGSMLFTLVEPHRGHEVAYNRWYERDHMYAGCMVGPWLYTGRRWVATADLKALRIDGDPPLFGAPRLGTYLAVYFVIAGKHDEHFSWGLKQVRWLHENGRMFDERDHIHTLLYRYAWAVGPDDGVPPELALDHPYDGLVATVVELAGGATVDDLRAAVHADEPDRLQLAFTPIPLPPGAPVNQPGLDNLDRRVLVLSFLPDRPTAALSSLAAGAGTVLWSAPFIPTIPGTDTYTDELW
jgi:hypothetical protein